MEVAWIGMGRIGKPMALRVIAAGHRLNGHARSTGKHNDLNRAQLTDSLQKVVATAAMVCVNVYDETQLREVLFDGGAIAAMRSNAILVIHSTVSPAAIHDVAAARGDIRVLDAAFSGTDRNAAEGSIALMVGGDAAVLAAARPVLASYANFIQHVGPSGAGMMLKLINNALFGAQMLLANDALRALTAVGIDKDVAVATLARSSGGSFAVQQFGPGIELAARMAGVLPYMQKDVAAARAAAQALNIDLGMLDIATRPFNTAA